MRDDTGTILIVEDDPNDVIFLKRAFARCQVANPVASVSDGQQALDYLCGRPPYDNRQAYPFPKVIVSDLKMPKVTGLELLRWLHDNPKYRVVPTVILTSSTEPRDVEQAFALGANAYMVKPVQFEDLERIVRAVVEYWRLSLAPSIEV
jgi:CheY-like chemotaxis protein